MSASSGLLSLLAPQLRKQNPCATLDQIAALAFRQTGSKVSRQRIYQILDRANVATKSDTKISLTCNQCKRQYSISRCLYQNALKEKLNSQGRHLGKIKILFCSPACQKAYNTVQVTCDYCGKQFSREIAQVNKNLLKTGQRYFFCKRQHQGFYMAEHFGFSQHSENISLGLKALRLKRSQNIK